MSRRASPYRRGPARARIEDAQLRQSWILGPGQMGWVDQENGVLEVTVMAYVARIMRRFACLSTGLLCLASVALANGDGVLGHSQSQSGHVDFVTSATFSTQSGTLTVAGIPAGASVRAAHLYYTVIRGSGASSVTFAGNSLAPVEIGVEGVGLNQRRWYRNDVTG